MNYLNYILFQGCAAFAGLMKSLTVGLLSIDNLQLEIKTVIGPNKSNKV